MFSTAGMHLAVLAFAAAILVAAGWRDLRSFTIPNSAVAAIAALYPVHVITAPEPVAWGMALALAGITFAFGCILFAVRAMGGGDVKLLTVAVLWAGVAHAVPFMLVTAAAGLVLAAAFAVHTAAASARASGGGMLGAASALRFVPVAKLTIPYGVAIAVGGLYVVARLFTG